MVALIGVSLIIYAQVLLPFNEVLACGADYGADYQTWLGPDGLANTADDVGKEPACTSPLPRMLKGLLPFWPLLALCPFAFVVFRFVGSPHSGITLLLTLAVVNVLRGVSGGDNTGTSVDEGLFIGLVVLIGLIVAVVPMPKLGFVPAFLHLVAIAPLARNSHRGQHHLWRCRRAGLRG